MTLISSKSDEGVAPEEVAGLEEWEVEGIYGCNCFMVLGDIGLLFFAGGTAAACVAFNKTVAKVLAFDYCYCF